MLVKEGLQSNEKVNLFENITAVEKSEIPAQYLPMWNTENEACFPHFLNYAESEMKGTLNLAENGNEVAILEISNQYQKFRNDIEDGLRNFDPSSYDAFIGAVAVADTTLAKVYMENYINELYKKQEDDDDD